jgi:hypothetical protein
VAGIERAAQASASASIRLETTGELFTQIDEALLGVSRYLANDLGQPRLDLVQARVSLDQLRELMRLLERELDEREAPPF